MEYKKYLKSEDWKKKRRQVKYWKGNRCVICRKKRVDIHHKTYKDLGNENVEFHLEPLCRQHHMGVHQYCKDNNVNYYNGTEQYIKKHKQPKGKLTWKNMTPLERKKYLGPAF